MHVIAAKAVAFGEALKPEFREYAENIVKNAKAFAEGLKAEGFRLVSGGTDNHLILVDVRNKNLTGKEAEKLLDNIGITCNKNTIPFDPASPFVTSGIRLGTPAATPAASKKRTSKRLLLLWAWCSITLKILISMQRLQNVLLHCALSIRYILIYN